MAFAIEPSPKVERDVRRAAVERLDNALARLEGLDDQPPAEIENAVHDVRKRTKEVRALARLVRESIGAEYGRFNELVRDAAEELSSIRDAHAVLATLDHLRVARDREHDAQLDIVRAAQAQTAAEATQAIRRRDPRLERARKRLVRARRRVKRWRIDDGSAWLEAGLTSSYRRAKRGMRRARRRPTDERLHEWRKGVKTLWYQIRLIEAAAPSMLTAFVAHLDDLAEALGDDHDLSVLVTQLESEPKRFGGKKPAKAAVRLARAQQDDLRHRAFRQGASLFAEPTSAFVARVVTYWETTIDEGPELALGGIAELVADELRGSPEPLAADRATAPAPAGTVERERKFLVPDLPDLPPTGVPFRQGYLAIDGSVSVRVRDAGPEGRTLTIKAGRGAIRTEFEWSLSRNQFDAAWPHTEGRRIQKTRYRLPLDGVAGASGSCIVELDVFHDVLDGLAMAEVEFDSEDALRAFAVPDWFGREVTDDEAYTNASLAARAALGVGSGPAS